MKLFAPKKETTKTEEIRFSDINYEKAYDELNDPEVMDNGWVQMNDSEKFNNYTEEY